MDVFWPLGIWARAKCPRSRCIIVGRHSASHAASRTVLCASALERTAYSTLMGKSLAQMVFIDPPYNVAIDGNVSGLGATRHREFVMASGEMSEEEFQQFLTKAFSLLARYSTPHSLHFVCMDWRHIAEMLTAGNDVYNELINCRVWVKDNAGMGSFL
jgi:hypothetical protein